MVSIFNLVLKTGPTLGEAGPIPCKYPFVLQPVAFCSDAVCVIACENLKANGCLDRTTCCCEI